jgi:hypothetical protein
MKNKITGFLVAFVGFGLVFSSGLGIYITETQNQDDDILENITDNPPPKDPPDPNKDDKGDDDKDDNKDDKDVIKAYITINPHVLNLKSKGKWITVFIEFMPEYSVEDIYPESVQFNNIYAEEKPTQISDFNNNGLLELMVKFDRSSVISLLVLEELDEVSFSGKLSDGKTFEGTCELAYL